ncbi:MAG TPA: NADH-quinone oxidoreductase subunit I [Armatimonadota bacterium]|nr:NADH-quinone oxidoreductase subunit I [Armatimonadota bacterium]HOS43547.1 NADH-quinone oxidoreductase subunit I [Armatimonadota bacterium]
MVTLINNVVSGIRAILVGMRVTWRNNFRKPVTIQYGYAPRWGKTETRAMSPRYRGRFTLIREPETGELRCTGCGLCAQACPGRCITVTGESRKVTSYQLDLEKCLFCGLCVEACPFEALGMMQETHPLQFKTREALHLTMETLAQPDGAEMPGVLPSTVGGDLRPGKKPYQPKTKKAADGAAGQTA